MKLGPVTRLEKRNTTTSKEFDNHFMAVNYDFIVIFPIYGQFGAIQKPDAAISLITTLHLTKTKSRIKKSVKSTHTIALSKGTIFAGKILIF